MPIFDYNVFYHFLLFSVNLVGNNAECSYEEVYFGYVPTKQECATLCAGVSSMFAYGNPPDRCEQGQCKCLCEYSASSDGTCSQNDNINFNLYRIGL